MGLLALTGLLVILAWSSAVDAQGYWETVVGNAGISTMHAAVSHDGNVVLLDRTNIGPSQLALAPGVCRNNPADRASAHDCTAHSALFSPGSNKIRPLNVYTDTWCSSGQFDGNGMLVQTGGDADGMRKIRHFNPCGGGNCDWVELDGGLQEGRWYASNQILPDGTQIVVGGRGVGTVEFVPANGRGAYNLPLLYKTNDFQMDNLYPFVHLLPNNQLFIFANRDSILYDWKTHETVREFPTIPGEPRNYPSAGSSVMLPLSAGANFGNAEVLVCGGAQLGAYRNPKGQPASQTCGRMAPLSANAGWAMETMPQRRLMGDMILLPTRDVLIINGAAGGAQGWGNAQNPVKTPVLYKTNSAAGARFQTLTGSPIPRVYHSTANLLPDGRILVAGSNTHQFYTLAGYLPTELRLETFSPPYAGGAGFAAAPGALKYGAGFTATIKAAGAKYVELNLASAPYVTHSYAQGQRLLQLEVGAPVAVAGGVTVASKGPPNAAVAPGGYYMLFPVADGKVGHAAWVKVG